MDKNHFQIPASVFFIANPLFLLIMVPMMTIELFLLYSTREPLYYSVVSVTGTIPVILGHLYSPPNIFKRGVLFIAQGFRHTKIDTEQERRYLNFVCTKAYKKIIIKIGLLFFSLPWIIFLFSVIDIPKTWEIFYRPLPTLERLVIAIGCQFILAGSGINILFAYYLQKNWVDIMQTNE